VDALRVGLLRRRAKAIVVAVAAGIGSVFQPVWATEYLSFQIFHYDKSVRPGAASALPPSMNVGQTVRDLVAAIGRTGDRRRKLGFSVGPLSFDQSDEQIIETITEAFRVARAQNVAVSFHIDDSMFWAGRRDLAGNIDNIEWLDWEKTPNKGRRLDWSATPIAVAPMLCLNAPAVSAAVANRARLIAKAVRAEADLLKREGREELFAGIIAGWETMIGRDAATGRALGYCALTHRGFSRQSPPKDIDDELSQTVRALISLWAQELHRGGVATDKIFSHIAFTPQGLQSGPAESYARSVGYAVPDVAFGAGYGPGFSTYPLPGAFKAIHDELAQRGSPKWISAEGANVGPNGLPGEASMEIYLARLFNHGAVMANIFGWGIGGEVERKTNMFRLAAESPDAIGAYRKFLSGADLQDANGSGNQFDPNRLVAKIKKIREMGPLWVQRGGDGSKLRIKMEALDRLIKESKFQEAERVADEILAMIGAP
jgi:hypothetical protein